MDRSLTISSIISYFEDKRILSRGENAYISGHVKNVIYDNSLQIVRGSIEASMKNKNYKIEVKKLIDLDSLYFYEKF